MHGKKKQGFIAGCTCLWLGILGLGCANEPEILENPKRLQLSALYPREGSEMSRSQFEVLAVFSDIVHSGSEGDLASLTKSTFFLVRGEVIPEVILSEDSIYETTIARLKLADSATLAAGRIEVVIRGTRIRGENTLELGTDIRSWFELTEK